MTNSVEGTQNNHLVVTVSGDVHQLLRKLRGLSFARSRGTGVFN
jgi:hypothetical protein